MKSRLWRPPFTLLRHPTWGRRHDVYEHVSRLRSAQRHHEVAAGEPHRCSRWCTALSGELQSSPPEGDAYPKNEHPVVISHPETGKKVLFVNSGFTSHIKGMHPFESKALLNMLFEHIDKTHRLTCRVAWEPNTLTLWDNRCTQHHAIWDYYPESRYGERFPSWATADQQPKSER